MNNQWNSFLQQQKASSVTSDCVLCDLSYTGLIRVQGKDAKDFLQGQLTNDINLVNANTAQLSAWCNPKGRMLAQFVAFEHDGHLHLQLPDERMDAVLQRLRMFVMRSDVVLTDVSEELVMLGISGSCTNDLLPDLESMAFSSQQHDGQTRIRMPGSTPRALLIGTYEQSKKFWLQAAEQAQQANQDYWQLLDIRAGLPQVFNATAETFVPQTLNLQLINGINFTKGCYTGQEVVARMKYLGQLKRRMYVAHFNSEITPKAGDKLFSASSKSPQGTGKIVTAQTTAEGTYEALVMLEIKSFETNDVQLGDAQGAKITLSTPPYDFEE